MNKKTLLLGVGASLLLAAGAANAGTCTTEIDQLSQTLGVPSDSPNATTGATDPGVQQPDPTAPIDLSAGASNSTTMEPTANAADPSGKSGVQQPDPGAEAEANAGAA